VDYNTLQERVFLITSKPFDTFLGVVFHALMKGWQ